MTRAEIAEVISGTGLPFAYSAFPVNEAPTLPYITYYYPRANDVKADNSNYCKVDDLVIELYTENKDFATEELVESALPFPYSKEVNYIDSEKMYQITYESEVIING